MTDKYILRGHTTMPCADLLKWAKWFETADRKVAADVVNGVRISTVFLGLDHAFGGAKPLLFETMIFGGKHDRYQDLCSTWDEAIAMHAKAVKLVKS